MKNASEHGGTILLKKWKEEHQELITSLGYIKAYFKKQKKKLKEIMTMCVYV